MFNKNKILSILLIVIIFGFASQVKAADVVLDWAKQIGSTGVDYGTNIATDTSGNIYTTGVFNGTVDFDPGAGTTNLTAPLTNSVYMAKYDASGNFVWAKLVGSRIVNLEDRVVPAVYLDSSDNIYSVGNFTGTVDFDPGAGTTNLTSAVGHYDLYITKYDSSGNFVWAKQIGGNNDVQPADIMVSGSNIYITGIFGGTIDFDPDAGTSNLTASGWVDGFILKFDLSGTLVWVKQYVDAGSHFEQPLSVTVDSSNNVYVSGEFTGTLDLDPGAGTANVTASGATWEMNPFISKLDSSGTYVWGKAFIGGTGWSRGVSVKVDSSSNVYVAGAFAGGTMDFDPDGGTYNLTATVGATQYINDIYVAKLNSLGALVWVKQIGSTGNDEVRSMQLDNDGNIYTAGLFNETVDFDPGVGTHNLTSNGAEDVYINKFDSSGNFVWVKQMGGTLSDTAIYTRALYVDPTGSLMYLTGRFLGTADFDPNGGTSSGTSAGDKDIFLLKLIPDPTAPSITPNSPSNITNTGVTISWTTNENSSSIVEYGTTSNYGTSTTESDTGAGVTSHSINLSNLTECTTYHYRVKSNDVVANLGTSSDLTFTTPGCSAVPVFILQAQSDAERLQPTVVITPITVPPTNVIVFCEGNYTFSPITGEKCTPHSNSGPILFTKNLQYGMRDIQVLELQKFLNNNGFPISITGIGSLNNETNYFGPATRTALIKYQIANNIKPAIGYFGTITRGVVNKNTN